MKIISITVLMFLIVIHAAFFQQSEAIAETDLTISQIEATSENGQDTADTKDQQEFIRMLTSERQLQLLISLYAVDRISLLNERSLEMPLFDEMDSAVLPSRQSSIDYHISDVNPGGDLMVLAETEDIMSDNTDESAASVTIEAKAEMRTGSITIARVTAYAPFDNQSGMCNDGNPNSTSTGQRPGPSIVAVDPKKIPYGTKLKIQGFDRVFTAGDTGSILRRYDGIAIDVYFDTYKETRRFGVRYLEIKILD